MGDTRPYVAVRTHSDLYELLKDEAEAHHVDDILAAAEFSAMARTLLDLAGRNIHKRLRVVEEMGP